MESEINQILRMLNMAHQSGFYAEMRSRYASTEQWKNEGPSIERDASACWHLAKIFICRFRDEVDKYIACNKDTEQAKILIAATQVIDKEVEAQFEKQILQEETMGRVKDSQIDELEQEEYDEDEEYLREQEALDERDLWDDDEYLGDVSDEEDEFFDDEE